VSSGINQLYEFGPFSLDPLKRQVRNQNQPVPLNSKAFDLLLVLVEASGRIVEKDELMKRLWPDSFVEEGNLSVQVSGLRKALGETPNDHQYILTVPGRGYRFAEPVRVIENGHGPAPRGPDYPVEARPRLNRWIGLAGALALVAGIAGWLYLSRPGQKSAVPLKITPVTSFLGFEVDPVFSPDGNQLAYAWNGEKGENYDIYVQQIGVGGEPLRLTHDPADDFSPVWSPDSQTVAFVRQSKTGTGVFLVPALGGHDRKLTDVAEGIPGLSSPVAWSRDGTSLVIVDKGSPGEQNSLFVFAIETGERRRLTPASAFGDSWPAVSPDGKIVAFFRNSNSYLCDVYVLPFTGGEPRRLTFFNTIMRGLTWTADGREILFSAYSDSTGSPSLWRIGASGGAPEPMIGLGKNISSPSVSRQGDRLAYVEFASDRTIWRVGGVDSSHKHPQPAMPIASSTRNDDDARYSADGKRIAFISDRSGNTAFWICDTEGHNVFQLGSDGKVGAYNWSPDSQHLAFDFLTSGYLNVFKMSTEGGVPRQLTFEKSNNVRPSWSRNGQWIYFGSDRGGDWQVWKIPSTGGPAVQVTRRGGFVALESPNGKFLYYSKDFPRGYGSRTAGLWRMPVEGGEEAPVIKTLEVGLGGYWDIIDKGIYFVETGSDKVASAPPMVLKFFSFATGGVKEIAPLEKRLMYGNQGLSASPDGRWVLYQDWWFSGSDIILVENFR
jgi:Tol biopolymer transport system component/DNA-binding winged helix-turn-helix (wHTH) protein